MKVKAGFKYKIPGIKGLKNKKDITVNVFFKSFNDKVIKCWVKDEHNGTTFLGMASCNGKEGDKFDERHGMELALRRALTKRTKFLDRRFKAIERFHTKVATNAATDIVSKLINMRDKGKIACSKKNIEDVK